MARYRALAAKYARLVARCEREAAARSSTVLLALAAMRASDTALATIRDGRIVVRNDRWIELSAGGALWRREAGGEDGGEHRLEEAVVREAEALGRTRALTRTSRWERVEGERFVEIRVERARTGDRDRLVLGIVTDLTERARTERELARMREALLSQERLRALSDLASGVAHELNNTLHALSLRLAQLRAGAARPSPALDRNLNAIDRIVRDAAARVRQLQDLARTREDAPKETIDLAEVVAGAIAAMEPSPETPGVRYAVECRLPPLPRAIGCAPEVQHVIVGLLLNARDAMPAGGRVTIGGRREGNEVVLEVADEGCGIPPEVLGRVFDPFFTTKGRRGTGLGLAIAAGMMRRLGGSIAAANRPGGGAVITLRFPIAPLVEPAAAGAVAPAEPVKALGGVAVPMQRVLVVDDDEDNLDALRWMLEHLGQRVEVAGSGADAIGRVEAGERYDLVLCDLGMPELDGWDVVQRLRPMLPRAGIYLVTGWAEQLSRDDPRLAAVAGILPKPLAVDDLERLLRGDEPATVRRPATAAAAPLR